MYKIKIGDKWISKDNMLVLTDNPNNAACLSKTNADNILNMLKYAYGKEIKIMEG